MASSLSILTPAGEIVEAVDASTLLAAAGLHNLPDAHTTELAAFDEHARLLEAIAREARGLTSDELVRRLDMAGRWTRREGAFEIQSASPEAGTTAYDTETLLAALRGLVAAGTISQQGADAAVEPVVEHASVPYDLLRRIASALQDDLDLAALEAVGHEVAALIAGEPEARYRQKPAGVKALLKLPAARVAVAACQVSVQPPRRVAKVKRVAA